MSLSPKVVFGNFAEDCNIPGLFSVSGMDCCGIVRFGLADNAVAACGRSITARAYRKSPTGIAARSVL